MKRQPQQRKWLNLLIDEVEANSYMQLMANATRALIMLEVPEMMRQAAGMGTE